MEQYACPQFKRYQDDRMPHQEDIRNSIKQLWKSDFTHIYSRVIFIWVFCSWLGLQPSSHLCTFGIVGAMFFSLCRPLSKNAQPPWFIIKHNINDYKEILLFGITCTTLTHITCKTFLNKNERKNMFFHMKTLQVTMRFMSFQRDLKLHWNDVSITCPFLSK